MKEKKSVKADLESKKVFFLEIGFIVVLAIVYFALEMKSYETTAAIQFERKNVIIEEEMVEITNQDQIDHIELPPPPAHQSLLFQEVDDDVMVETDIVIDAEADGDTEIAPAVWKAPVVEEVIHEEEIFMIVEQVPEYPGGDEARLNFLRNNIKYPQMAREAGIQGTVYVSFTVEKDGSITQVKIARGIGGGCDEEAIRVTRMMPKWKAGKQRGKEVRVSYNMPIKFTLQD
ncbi:MAG: energy transducer TonB [Bacteroidales bacterium]|nr:energy transducer TonB [Bacteroidales bacterium]